MVGARSVKSPWGHQPESPRVTRFRALALLRVRGEMTHIIGMSERHPAHCDWEPASLVDEIDAALDFALDERPRYNNQLPGREPHSPYPTSSTYPSPPIARPALDPITTTAPSQYRVPALSS